MNSWKKQGENDRAGHVSGDETANIMGDDRSRKAKENGPDRKANPGSAQPWGKCRRIQGATTSPRKFWRKCMVMGAIRLPRQRYTRA